MIRLKVLLLLAVVVLPPLNSAPVASMASLAFLSGRWTETSSDSEEEEYWSPILNSSMVGSFRVVKDGNPVFYDFWVIEIENGKVVFHMKHFGTGLIGWEEKAESVSLNLSVGALQDVTFRSADGNLSLRYRLTGGELECTLHRIKAGKASDEVFHLHQAGQETPSHHPSPKGYSEKR